MHDRFFEIPDLKIEKEIKDLANKEYNSWSNYSSGKNKLYSYTFAPRIPVIELTNLYNKFKAKEILGQCSLLKVMPGHKVLPHVDAFRSAAINIPLSNNVSECYTSLYEAKGWRKLLYLPNLFYKDGKVKLNPGGAYPLAKMVYKLQYEKPVCLNVSKIHGVKNNSKSIRYVLSISIRPQYTYEDVYTLYKNGDLI